MNEKMEAKVQGKGKKEYGFRDFLNRVFTLFAVVVFVIFLLLSFSQSAKADEGHQSSAMSGILPFPVLCSTTTELLEDIKEGRLIPVDMTQVITFSDRGVSKSNYIKLVDNEYNIYHTIKSGTSICILFVEKQNLKNLVKGAQGVK